MTTEADALTQSQLKSPIYQAALEIAALWSEPNESDVEDVAAILRKHFTPPAAPPEPSAEDALRNITPNCDEWAAEHPADENEPIDHQWLRSIGARKDDHPQKWTFERDDNLPIGLWHVDDGWKAVLILAPNASATIVRGIKTRGQLRKLAEVLGIEPKATNAT